MLVTLFQALRAEWLKQKHTLALALVGLGALFVPAVTFIIRLHRPERLPALYRSPRFWESLWKQEWQPMAILLLPLGVVLITTLLVQIEYRNNTWKQVHASPQPLGVIFVAKLAVAMALLAGLFVTFDLATWLVGVVPPHLHDYIPAGHRPLPWRWLLERNVVGYVAVLPIVAMQFLLGLRFRNFMVPLGAGVALWLTAVLGTSWHYAWLLPYGYGALDYLQTASKVGGPKLPADISVIALVAFALFTGSAYTLYATQRRRG